MTSDPWMFAQYPEFKDLWEDVAPHTMTTPERGFALWQAVGHVLENNIQGAFVECGVWKGGSALLIARTLKARGVLDREIFLFDTFSGMTEAAPIDRDIHGIHADDYIAGQHGDRLQGLVQASASLDEVQGVVEASGYDSRLIRYIAGDVRETLERTQTLGIALLRLDTDFYDSSYAEMETLYPRVSQDGVVIVDDYGHWQGAQQAIDDYFAAPSQDGRAPMLWAIDYTGRGFVKPDPPRKIEIERYDFVPPGMADPTLMALFPEAKLLDPWTVPWAHLRPHVPHRYRCDTRDAGPYTIGNASLEEAVCLHTLAQQFRGKRGLEIGSHFGWTAAHLRAAGLDLDLVDPAFVDPGRCQAVAQVLDAIDTPHPYRIWPLCSPDAVSQIAPAAEAPWSFAFIDGDHDADAPEQDALAVIGRCAEDAVIVFHDMTSPDVARGLAICQDDGWQVCLFNTMQILGIAWRGDVDIPAHRPDPNAGQIFYPHLQRYL